MSLLQLVSPCWWISRVRDWMSWREEEWYEAVAADYRSFDEMARGWRHDEEAA